MKRIAKLNRKSIRRAYDLSSACEQIGDLAKFEFLEELRDEAYFYAFSKGSKIEFCFALWEKDVTLEFRMTLDDAINEIVSDLDEDCEDVDAYFNDTINSLERAIKKLKKAHQKFYRTNKENT